MKHVVPAGQTHAHRPKPRLRVTLAANEDAITEAQKLRWRVFADEMGARLPSPTPGIDRDIYDPYCDHLIVHDESTGHVVGTYRILTPEKAIRVGGYYSETEFDLARLAHLRPHMVEVGRSCVDADHRTGGAIALLWSGMAGYMRDNGHETLIGCVSVAMHDGGRNAAGLYNQLAATHLAPPEYRVFPHCPLPLARIAATARPEPPPLLKGCLRAGAWICGEPAWDPDFNTADFLVMMTMSRIEARYSRRFVARRN